MSEETKTVNYMGGLSYTLKPLDTLKLVCTSMICGQDQYYRTCSDKTPSKFRAHMIFQEQDETYFDRTVSRALDDDYEGVIQFIGQLRNEYMMRLNTHVLLTAAIHHPKRVEFNASHPNVMKQAIQTASNIPTDWATQGKLLLESGKPIPTIWKKTIAAELEKMSRYHAAKYIHGTKTKKATNRKPKSAVPEPAPVLQPPPPKKSRELSLIDLVRLTHPKSTEVIDELLRTGKVEVSETEETWERLRSKGATWTEITRQIRLPHMALLRNLRNIVEEWENSEVEASEMDRLVEQLIGGVKNGKQFPFRYYSAYEAMRCHSENVSKTATTHSVLRKRVIHALNQCLLDSLETMPKMNGYIHCLSDNSGSARGGFVSEYGKVTVRVIANLSSLLTAYTSEQGGSVWVFGDKLKEYKVSKTIPILEQLDQINALGDTVGASTETGIWLFWEKVIKERTPLDTVFVYSDMQAGHGELYAENKHIPNLLQCGGLLDPELNRIAYIDMLSLVKTYRETVKRNVNLFSVQVAGYDNTVLPEILYRGSVLAGWTGKESKLAYEMIRLWDSVEGL